MDAEIRVLEISQQRENEDKQVCDDTDHAKFLDRICTGLNPTLEISNPDINVENFPIKRDETHLPTVAETAESSENGDVRTSESFREAETVVIAVVRNEDKEHIEGDDFSKTPSMSNVVPVVNGDKCDEFDMKEANRNRAREGKGYLSGLPSIQRPGIHTEKLKDQLLHEVENTVSVKDNKPKDVGLFMQGGTVNNVLREEQKDYNEMSLVPIDGKNYTSENTVRKDSSNSKHPKDVLFLADKMTENVNSVYVTMDDVLYKGEKENAYLNITSRYETEEDFAETLEQTKLPTTEEKIHISKDNMENEKHKDSSYPEDEEENTLDAEAEDKYQMQPHIFPSESQTELHLQNVTKFSKGETEHLEQKEINLVEELEQSESQSVMKFQKETEFLEVELQGQFKPAEERFDEESEEVDRAVPEECDKEAKNSMNVSTLQSTSESIDEKKFKTDGIAWENVSHQSEPRNAEDRSKESLPLFYFEEQINKKCEKTEKMEKPHAEVQLLGTEDQNLYTINSWDNKSDQDHQSLEKVSSVPSLIQASTEEISDKLKQAGLSNQFALSSAENDLERDPKKMTQTLEVVDVGGKEMQGKWESAPCASLPTEEASLQQEKAEEEEFIEDKIEDHTKQKETTLETSKSCESSSIDTRENDFITEHVNDLETGSHAIDDRIKHDLKSCEEISHESGPRDIKERSEEILHSLEGNFETQTENISETSQLHEGLRSPNIRDKALNVISLPHRKLDQENQFPEREVNVIPSDFKVQTEETKNEAKQELNGKDLEGIPIPITVNFKAEGAGEKDMQGKLEEGSCGTFSKKEASLQKEEAGSMKFFSKNMKDEDQSKLFVEEPAETNISVAYEYKLISTDTDEKSLNEEVNLEYLKKPINDENVKENERSCEHIFQKVELQEIEEISQKPSKLHPLEEKSEVQIKNSERIEGMQKFTTEDETLNVTNFQEKNLDQDFQSSEREFLLLSSSIQVSMETTEDKGTHKNLIKHIFPNTNDMEIETSLRPSVVSLEAEDVGEKEMQGELKSEVYVTQSTEEIEDKWEQDLNEQLGLNSCEKNLEATPNSTVMTMETEYVREIQCIEKPVENMEEKQTTLFLNARNVEEKQMHGNCEEALTTNVSLLQQEAAGNKEIIEDNISDSFEWKEKTYNEKPEEITSLITRGCESGAHDIGDKEINEQCNPESSFEESNKGCLMKDEIVFSHQLGNQDTVEISKRTTLSYPEEKSEVETKNDETIGHTDEGVETFDTEDEVLEAITVHDKKLDHDCQRPCKEVVISSNMSSVEETADKSEQVLNVQFGINSSKKNLETIPNTITVALEMEDVREMHRIRKPDKINSLVPQEDEPRSTDIREEELSQRGIIECHSNTIDEECLQENEIAKEEIPHQFLHKDADKIYEKALRLHPQEEKIEVENSGNFDHLEKKVQNFGNDNETLNVTGFHVKNQDQDLQCTENEVSVNSLTLVASQEEMVDKIKHELDGEFVFISNEDLEKDYLQNNVTLASLEEKGMLGNQDDASNACSTTEERQQEAAGSKRFIQRNIENCLDHKEKQMFSSLDEVIENEFILDIDEKDPDEMETRKSKDPSTEVTQEDVNEKHAKNEAPVTCLSSTVQDLVIETSQEPINKPVQESTQESSGSLQDIPPMEIKKKEHLSEKWKKNIENLYENEVGSLSSNINKSVVQILQEHEEGLEYCSRMRLERDITEEENGEDSASKEVGKKEEPTVELQEEDKKYRIEKETISETFTAIQFSKDELSQGYAALLSQSNKLQTQEEIIENSLLVQDTPEMKVKVQEGSAEVNKSTKEDLLMNKHGDATFTKNNVIVNIPQEHIINPEASCSIVLQGDVQTLTSHDFQMLNYRTQEEPKQQILYEESSRDLLKKKTRQDITPVEKGTSGEISTECAENLEQSPQVLPKERQGGETSTEYIPYENAENHEDLIIKSQEMEHEDLVNKESIEGLQQRQTKADAQIQMIDTKEDPIQVIQQEEYMIPKEAFEFSPDDDPSVGEDDKLEPLAVKDEENKKLSVIKETNACEKTKEAEGRHKKSPHFETGIDYNENQNNRLDQSGQVESVEIHEEITIEKPESPQIYDRFSQRALITGDRHGVSAPGRESVEIHHTQREDIPSQVRDIEKELIKVIEQEGLKPIADSEFVETQSIRSNDKLPSVTTEDETNSILSEKMDAHNCKELKEAKRSQDVVPLFGSGWEQKENGDGRPESPDQSVYVEFKEIHEETIIGNEVLKMNDFPERNIILEGGRKESEPEPVENQQLRTEEAEAQSQVGDTKEDSIQVIQQAEDVKPIVDSRAVPGFNENMDDNDKLRSDSVDYDERKILSGTIKADASEELKEAEERNKVDMQWFKQDENENRRLNRSDHEGFTECLDDITTEKVEYLQMTEDFSERMLIPEDRHMESEPELALIPAIQHGQDMMLKETSEFVPKGDQNIDYKVNCEPATAEYEGKTPSETQESDGYKETPDAKETLKRYPSDTEPENKENEDIGPDHPASMQPQKSYNVVTMSTPDIHKINEEFSELIESIKDKEDSVSELVDIQQKQGIAELQSEVIKVEEVSIQDIQQQEVVTPTGASDFVPDDNQSISDSQKLENVTSENEEIKSLSEGLDEKVYEKTQKDEEWLEIVSQVETGSVTNETEDSRSGQSAPMELIENPEEITTEEEILKTHEARSDIIETKFIKHMVPLEEKQGEVNLQLQARNKQEEAGAELMIREVSFDLEQSTYKNQFFLITDEAGQEISKVDETSFPQEEARPKSENILQSRYFENAVDSTEEKMGDTHADDQHKVSNQAEHANIMSETQYSTERILGKELDKQPFGTNNKVSSEQKSDINAICKNVESQGLHRDELLRVSAANSLAHEVLQVENQKLQGAPSIVTELQHPETCKAYINYDVTNECPSQNQSLVMKQSAEDDNKLEKEKDVITLQQSSLRVETESMMVSREEKSTDEHLFSSLEMAKGKSCIEDVGGESPPDPLQCVKKESGNGSLDFKYEVPIDIKHKLPAASSAIETHKDVEIRKGTLHRGPESTYNETIKGITDSGTSIKINISEKEEIEVDHRVAQSDNEREHGSNQEQEEKEPCEIAPTIIDRPCIKNEQSDTAEMGIQARNPDTDMKTPDLQKLSWEEINEMAEQLKEEKHLADTGTDSPDEKTVSVQADIELAKKIEEKDEEEENHPQITQDAQIIVGSKNKDHKTTQKKHNILSNVGSKVKHSLGKVKKVITGKSSHNKSQPHQAKE